MQTSRFQLGLIAALAVGLGFSLSSSDAVGYPAGAPISLGSNPMWSQMGTVERGGGSVDVLTVPVDQVAVVTAFSSNAGNYFDIYQDGTMVLDGHANAYDKIFGANQGGLVIEGGSTLRVVNSDYPTGTNLYYIQGYYLQQ